MLGFGISRRIISYFDCTREDIRRSLGDGAIVFHDSKILFSWVSSGRFMVKDAVFRVARIEGTGRIEDEEDGLSMHLRLHLTQFYAFGAVLVHFIFLLSLLWFLTVLFSGGSGVYIGVLFAAMWGGLDYIMLKQVGDGFDRVSKGLEATFKKIETKSAHSE